MFINSLTALPFAFSRAGTPCRNYNSLRAESHLFRMWTPSSELVSDVAWDAKTLVLWLVIGQNIYAYSIPDFRIALGFLTATSKGGFYNLAIKGRFPVAKITADDVITTPRVRRPIYFVGGVR